MAVVEACTVLKVHLRPYKEAKSDAKWEDWVSAAYFDRASLSPTGLYKTPDIGYAWEKNCDNLFKYFIQGTSVSEVEIDCLTGDHTVLRTDIVMDVG